MRILLLLIASMTLLACEAVATVDVGASSQATDTAPEPTASTTATPAATESPVVGSTAAYRLDCGPLEQEPCEASAARMVEKMRERHPTKTVVSIEYLTPCGSFQLQFDDGSGAGGDIDCILTTPSTTD